MSASSLFPVTVSRVHSSARDAAIAQAWFAVNAPDMVVRAAALSWAELLEHPAFPTDIVVIDVVSNSLLGEPKNGYSLRARSALSVILSNRSAGRLEVTDFSAAGIGEFGGFGSLRELRRAIRQVFASVPRRQSQPQPAWTAQVRQ